MQCIILAGGLAIRMLPLTKDKPKSLITIFNKPFIDYQLDYLTNNGIDDIILCIGHLGHMIKDHVGTSFNKVNISYLDEGELLTGTGGAIRKLYDQHRLNSSFGIIYGDSYLPINFNEVYNKFLSSKHDAMMTIFENNGKFDTSNVIVNNELILYDKKHVTKSIDYFTHIDYGFSILSNHLISEIPQNEKYALHTLLHKLSLENRLAGFEVKERFYEVGSFQGLQDFTDWINK
jgi:NDP-sugar pyrophosphorylase family protein